MSERGSITVWLLGLSMAMLSLGVLAVDVWDLMANRRELAALADTAARAAAEAIDEAAWRGSRELRLDRAAALQAVDAILGAHPEAAADLDPRVVFDHDGVTVTVTLTRTVDAALLGLAGRHATTIGASSQATATLRD